MTDAPENLDGVMRRVQKLLAIAADSRANPAEAANAAAMAEKIMRKYQIDNADLVMRAVKQGDDMVTADVVVTAKTNGTRVEEVPPWASWLAVSIAHLNNCGVQLAHDMKSKRFDRSVRFYGYKGDVQVSEYMMRYLAAAVNRLCTEYRTSFDYRVNGRKAMNSYRHGVTHGIMSVLDRLAAEKEAEGRAVSSSTALVVVKQQAITEKFGDVFSTKEATKSQVKQGASFVAGILDGKKVDVERRGIQGNAAQPTLQIGGV